MKQKLCLALLSCIALTSFVDAVAPYYSIRSQSVDLARQLVGTRDIEEELRCSDDCWPGYLGVTLEYTKSFHANRISECLFGDCLLNNGCCQAIKVSGSRVEDRGDSDWLADNFGLPTNYQGTLNFNPRITNVLGDFQAYLRLDRWLCGLYFYIHAPVVHTKWNMNVCEDVMDAGGATGYAEGYFAPNAVGRDNLVKTAGDFLSGRATPNLGDDVTFNRLENARWDLSGCARTKTALADLRFWLGYDWLNCDCYGFGLGLVVAAPTGNTPDSRYLFEPIVGNGHHWEFGGLVKGDYTFWENCDGTHRVTGYTQANITHLFSAKQCRTFDLCGKPLSRYMLAEKLGANDDNPVLEGSPNSTTEVCPTAVADLTVSNNQFAGEYTSVANLTTLCVDVSTNVQVDWVAMATYSRCNFTWDLGYELWYRGCEKIKPRDCDASNLIAANTWALKGDAYTYGFLSCGQDPFTEDSPIALGATESGATIKRGTNFVAGNLNQNEGVDNAQFAYATQNGSISTVGADRAGENGQQLTSIQPVFLSSDDIDLCSARTKGLSNKIFTHVSYNWDCACWNPYLGIGAMGEFGQRNGSKKDCKTNSCKTTACSTSSCDTKSNDCQKCSLSQWGIWIKGGFVFG
ncbi:MAG: hypothetical protein WD055_06170 [Candidatus Dependentiae bacterium]